MLSIPRNWSSTRESNDSPNYSKKMETQNTTLPQLVLPSEIQKTFERSHAFLARKYDGVAPNPEELIIFYLSSVEAHEVVANLERQVLQVSGKTVPDQNDHLIQTYLDMENERDLNPRK